MQAIHNMKEKPGQLASLEAPLDRAVPLASKGNPDVITILQELSSGFPVYWTHYACWLAVVRTNMALLRTESLYWEDCSTLWTGISSKDFEWTKLWVDLIQLVKNQSQGETIDFVLFFLITITDFNEEKTELLAFAHSAAANIPKEIALCVLGPRKGYIDRVCRNSRLDVFPSSDIDWGIFSKVLN